MKTKPSRTHVVITLVGMLILSFFAGEETFSWAFLNLVPNFFFWIRLGLIGMSIYFFSSTQMWASSKDESHLNFTTCLALAGFVFALGMAAAKMMS